MTNLWISKLGCCIQYYYTYLDVGSAAENDETTGVERSNGDKSWLAKLWKSDLGVVGLNNSDLIGVTAVFSDFLCRFNGDCVSKIIKCQYLLMSITIEKSNLVDQNC